MLTPATTPNPSKSSGPTGNSGHLSEPPLCSIIGHSVCTGIPQRIFKLNWRSITRTQISKGSDDYRNNILFDVTSRHTYFSLPNITQTFHVPHIRNTDPCKPVHSLAAIPRCHYHKSLCLKSRSFSKMMMLMLMKK